MSLDELISDLKNLPAADLDQVVDFVAWLQTRRGGDEHDGELDAVAADPAATARLQEMISVGMEQSRRGEGRPAAEVFAELRARSRKVQGLE